MPDEVHFEVATVVDCTVRVTRSAWSLVVGVKHPVMTGRLEAVRLALEAPEEVRASRIDESVLLFYRTERPGRWVCVIVKRLDGDGFLITAYPTDAIKEGLRIWP